MREKYMKYILLIASALSVIAVGAVIYERAGSGKGPNNSITSAAGITISKSSLTLYVNGENGALTAAVLPPDGENRSITWSAADNKIADVTQDGTVIPKGVGETEIIAAAAGSKHTAVCIVTVKEAQDSEVIPDALTTISVSNSDELIQAINALNSAENPAGTQILLTNGVTYSGTFKIYRNGSSENPIVIRSASAPESESNAPVIDSDFTVAGSHVWFNNVNITKQAYISNASFTRFLRCWFVKSTETQSIYVYGSSNNTKVEYCYFRGVSNPRTDDQAALKTKPSSGTYPKNVHIRYCHFHNFNKSSSTSNGHIIEFGESPVTTNHKMDSIVEYCLFSNDNSPAVSSTMKYVYHVKSSCNTIRYCTFINTREIMIRHGVDNKLLGLYFKNCINAITIHGKNAELLGFDMQNSPGNRIDLMAGTCSYDLWPDDRIESGGILLAHPSAYNVLIAGVRGNISLGNYYSDWDNNLSKYNAKYDSDRTKVDVYNTRIEACQKVDGNPVTTIDDLISNSRNYHTGTTISATTTVEIPLAFEMTASDVGPLAAPLRSEH